MPVTTLQRRFRELGRIRMGAVVPTSSGKTRPASIDKWRLTAYGEIGRTLLTQAAERLGGTPQPWSNPLNGDRGFELFTETDSLEIVIPPTENPYSVWLEKWTAAGCERRCDGERAQVYGGRGVGWRTGPCRCEDPTNPAKRQCAITFRFGVLLPWLDGLGVWHVQTHSFHGAEELQGALSVLGMRAAEGIITPAKLRIERRETRRPATKADGSTSVEVSKFVVPVIDVEQTLAQLVSGEGARIALPGAKVPEGRPALPAGRPALPAAPVRDPLTPPPGPDDDPGPSWEPLGPPEGEDAARAPEALEGEVVSEGRKLSRDDRKDVADTWTALGFTAEEIQAVMRDVAGVDSTAELTDTSRWAVEGELRRMAAERKPE